MHIARDMMAGCSDAARDRVRAALRLNNEIERDCALDEALELAAREASEQELDMKAQYCARCWLNDRERDRVERADPRRESRFGLWVLLVLGIVFAAIALVF